MCGSYLLKWNYLEHVCYMARQKNIYNEVRILQLYWLIRYRLIMNLVSSRKQPWVCTANHGSRVCAGQSRDCANPRFARNILCDFDACDFIYIASNSKRNIFQAVYALDFLFSALHTTPFLYAKIHFEVLNWLRASIATFDTPPGSNPP